MSPDVIFTVHFFVFTRRFIMSTEYRHNHYVPEWYQKRFIDPLSKDKTLYYMDLKPGTFVDSRGVEHSHKAVKRTGPNQCFAETDLYTTQFGEIESIEIERTFFGQIDSNGRAAVEYFSSFTHQSIGKAAFKNMVLYMSTQKLRTPKGLKWLSEQIKSDDQNSVLKAMLGFRQLYSAIWTECVWQIVDAVQSDTKFIISDHPITVYNRRCGPRSFWCKGVNDPDIRYHATHTIFPLSIDKILILTNLSWARNPYQKEVDFRPYPVYLRGAIFKFTDVQILRHLNEHEVKEINFIIKTRAHRYIGAGKEEWLYPENDISKSNWHDYGNGYLLMSDPRPIQAGGDMMFGWKDGTVTGVDAYGRRPWHKDYCKESADGREFETLQRFKGEFALLFGPYRRGRSFSGITELDNEKDSDDYHQYHLSLNKRRHSQ